MTPDVVVDIGNSRMKWGRCRDGRICRMCSLQSQNSDAWERKAVQWDLPRPTRWVVAGVTPNPLLPFWEWTNARGDTLAGIVRHEEVGLPLAVDEPDRVGIDRLLTALAAVRRSPPGRPVVVVNVGTAMTVDCVSPDGVFLGGAILPGPWTMAKSLRDNTAGLPLVEVEPMMIGDYPGKNTHDAVKVGVYAAITGAAYNVVWEFAEQVGQPVSVFVTGGGSRFLRAHDFPDTAAEVVFDRRLTLDGIRIAAEGLP